MEAVGVCDEDNEEMEETAGTVPIDPSAVSNSADEFADAPQTGSVCAPRKKNYKQMKTNDQTETDLFGILNRIMRLNRDDGRRFMRTDRLDEIQRLLWYRRVNPQGCFHCRQFPFPNASETMGLNLLGW